MLCVSTRESCWITDPRSEPDYRRAIVMTSFDINCFVIISLSHTTFYFNVLYRKCSLRKTEYVILSEICNINTNTFLIRF